MAKIICQCGEEFQDNMEQLPYKSWFLADQDLQNYEDSLHNNPSKKRSNLREPYFGVIYQCARCGNLIVFSPHKQERYDFSPTSTIQAKNITQSYLRKHWKGSITAHYYTQSYAEKDRRGTGEIYWNTNEDNGFNDKLSLEQLGTFYYQLKSQFQKQRILDNSIFKIDNEIQDQWKYI